MMSTAVKALVRRPGPRLAEGIVTHIERQPIDYALACEQWHAYVQALRDVGWTPIEVPPADDCPDSVFVEDTMVVYGQVAVMASPNEPSRRAELGGARNVVEGLGLLIEQIEPPGTLDGGDVLKIGDTIYVGRSGRTNDEGCRQLREILSPLGATIIAVPVHRVLHLKSAVTALPDGTVIGYPPLVDEPEAFPKFLPVPEEHGAHVVVVDDQRVIMAGGCPETERLFSDLGYDPLPVEISEFEKLEGCVTCLSVRLRHLPDQRSATPAPEQ